MSENIVEGSLKDFHDDSIIIGKELAKTLGTFKGDHLQILSAETHVSRRWASFRVRELFEVVGLFSSGLYDYDSSWVYVPLAAAQRLLGLGDVASGRSK